MVVELLTRSITPSTGPPAAALIRSAASAGTPKPSTAWVAPAFNAARRLVSATSTETMLRWPSAFRISMAESPRPPAPMSTMGLSGEMGISFLTAA